MGPTLRTYVVVVHDVKVKRDVQTGGLSSLGSCLFEADPELNRNVIGGAGAPHGVLVGARFKGR